MVQVPIVQEAWLREVLLSKGSSAHVRTEGTHGSCGTVGIAYRMYSKDFLLQLNIYYIHTYAPPKAADDASCHVMLHHSIVNRQI